MEFIKLIGNQQVIKSNGDVFLTLKDILPEDGPMKMLIIAKTPALTSVNAGHYFQGKQGKMFWNMLKKYKLLTVTSDQFEDDSLMKHGYGITDIVKMPHEYSKEPTREEYRVGAKRIIKLIERLQPNIIMFVYKKVLDKIVEELGVNFTSNYGFNPQLDNLFGSKVFVFPMPGTRCTKEQQIKAMNELVSVINTNFCDWEREMKIKTPELNENEYFENLWNHHFKGLNKKTIYISFEGQIKVIDCNDDYIELLLNEKFYFKFEKQLFKWAITRLKENNRLTYLDIRKNNAISGNRAANTLREILLTVPEVIYDLDGIIGDIIWQTERI